MACSSDRTLFDDDPARVEGTRILHRVERVLPAGPTRGRRDVGRRVDPGGQHTARLVVSAIVDRRHGLPTTTVRPGAGSTAIEVDRIGAKGGERGRRFQGRGERWVGDSARFEALRS